LKFFDTADGSGNFAVESLIAERFGDIFEEADGEHPVFLPMGDGFGFGIAFLGFGLDCE
jgi:hypothetical protein